jgi:hypothetical protein
MGVAIMAVITVVEGIITNGIAAKGRLYTSRKFAGYLGSLGQALLVFFQWKNLPANYGALTSSSVMLLRQKLAAAHFQALSLRLSWLTGATY